MPIIGSSKPVYKVLCGDCLKLLPTQGQFDCVFIDPPDNIGLSYANYNDNRPYGDYLAFVRDLILECCKHTSKLWVSFNARWSAEVGAIIFSNVLIHNDWTYRACVQTFTFGQHNHKWLGNNHRPLWCIYRRSAKFYPERIRIQSWRQEHGDPRADPRGRVPGDVFDFTRVTGNSRQRRNWCPTQLNEGLVERVLKFSCPARGSVLDPCAGSGTTLIVAKQLKLSCTCIDIDPTYCEKMHGQPSE